MGVSESDRHRLLNEKVNDFNRVRTWGESLQIVAFATNDLRPKLERSLPVKGKEKIVETEVITTDYEQESKKASVQARIKYFRVPYYVVEERIEKQSWEFNLSEGWKLSDLEVIS